MRVTAEISSEAIIKNDSVASRVVHLGFCILVGRWRQIGQLFLRCSSTQTDMPYHQGRRDMMPTVATTPEFKNGLKFEDCRNCRAERPGDYKPPNL